MENGTILSKNNLKGYLCARPYVRVIAIGTGDYRDSEPSDKQSATTEQEPVVPNDPLDEPKNVTVTAQNTESIAVSWSAVSNATGYVIEWATDEDFDEHFDTHNVSGGGTVTYTIHGLQANTLYYVRIMTIGNAETHDDSDWSETKSTTTHKIVLSVPTDVTEQACTDTTLVIHWTGDENADGYEIQWALNVDDFEPGETILGTEHSSTASFEIEGLNPNTSYYVRVRATGSGDYVDSHWSAPVPFTTAKEDDVPLDPPTGIKMDGHSETTLDISWSGDPKAGWIFPQAFFRKQSIGHGIFHPCAVHFKSNLPLGARLSRDCLKNAWRR